MRANVFTFFFVGGKQADYRGDLIEGFIIFKGFDNVNYTDLLKLLIQVADVMNLSLMNLT